LTWVGFASQFRSETILGSYRRDVYRLAGYVAPWVALGASAAWRLLAKGAGVFGGAWALLLLAALPMDRTSLLMAPGLFIGLLWWDARPLRPWKLDFLEEHALRLAASALVIAVDLSGPLRRAGVPAVGAFLQSCEAWLPTAVAVLGWVAAGRLRPPFRRPAVLAAAFCTPALVIAGRWTAGFDILACLAVCAMVLARLRKLPVYFVGLAAGALLNLLVHRDEALATVVVGLAVLAMPRAGRSPLVAAAAILFARLALQLRYDATFSFSDYEPVVFVT
jgi:hypothetical protein